MNKFLQYINNNRNLTIENENFNIESDTDDVIKDFDIIGTNFSRFDFLSGNFCNCVFSN